MKRNIVSTSLIAVIASMFALGFRFPDSSNGIMPSVQAQEEESHNRKTFQCTAQYLRGNYGVLANGVFIQGPPGVVGPFAAVGRLTLKANRTFSLNLTENFNGTIGLEQTTGTFTINNDCTGTFTIANVISFSFVVVDKGREIQFMRSQDSPGTRTVITGVAKRQLH